MSEVVVECTDVRHAYGRRQALQGLTAAMGPGLIGLLGPNGAGKSTLMGLLATLSRLQSGTIKIGDDDISDIDAIRRRVGFLPQEFTMPALERVRTVVEYAAWARGVDKKSAAQAAQTAMAATGIDERARERVRSLSGGYRQRLGIACALAGEPSLILLDEPTVGIDPVQRVQIRQLLAQAAQTATVVVATHLLEDLDVPGASVVVINEGRALFQGSVPELAQLGAAEVEPGQRPLEAGYVAALRRQP